MSQADGNTIKAGLAPGGTATLSRNAEFGCGSHTATGVPDRNNDRLLVYNSSSAGGVCDFFEIVEVPLDSPEDAEVINRIDSMHTCHDIGVILADLNKAACAGGEGARIFSLDPADGGSLDDPVLMHHFDVPGVTIGHSAAWSWDGEVLVFGHEPGGGTQARCQATSALVDRTLFFYDADGNQLGTFVHPRPQTAQENCTWHNYDVVPTDKGRILVSGNYQSDIGVLDFTDPTNVSEIAFADPAPLFDPDNAAAIEGGGDWSTYWYNGLIYESDMTRGLTIWNLTGPAVAGARKFGHSNPQTMETSFELKDQLATPEAAAARWPPRAAPPRGAPEKSGAASTNGGRRAAGPVQTASTTAHRRLCRSSIAGPAEHGYDVAGSLLHLRGDLRPTPPATIAGGACGRRRSALQPHLATDAAPAVGGPDTEDRRDLQAPGAGPPHRGP